MKKKRATMSLRFGQLSPDGKTVALVMNTGDADRDQAPRIVRLPSPARRLMARQQKAPARQ
jgi:hypothetical protein